MGELSFVIVVALFAIVALGFYYLVPYFKFKAKLNQELKLKELNLEAKELELAKIELLGEKGIECLDEENELLLEVSKRYNQVLEDFTNDIAIDIKTSEKKILNELQDTNDRIEKLELKVFNKIDNPTVDKFEKVLADTFGEE